MREMGDGAGERLRGIARDRAILRRLLHCLSGGRAPSPGMQGEAISDRSRRLCRDSEEVLVAETLAVGSGADIEVRAKYLLPVDAAQVQRISLYLAYFLHAILGTSNSYLGRAELLVGDAIAKGFVHIDRLNRLLPEGELVKK